MLCLLAAGDKGRHNSFDSDHRLSPRYPRLMESDLMSPDDNHKHSICDQQCCSINLNGWHAASLPHTTKYSDPRLHGQPSLTSEPRRANLRLPSFSDLGIGHSTLAAASRDSAVRQSLAGTNMSPLLTPPPDYIPTTGLSSASVSGHQRTSMSGSTQSHGEGGDSVVTPQTSARSRLGLNLAQSLHISDETSMQHQGWVEKSAETILSFLNSSSSIDHLQVISQTLPSQARDSRTKPTFEVMLEKVQLGLNHAPFITITHAVPQARTMDELPKTPPSTPRPTENNGDYFADDQTIFTHAAVVPIYHDHVPVTAEPVRVPRSISAPTVQISILERYIPPTMPEEMSDFFGSSWKRSYLFDRLSELSPQNGTLLLVYPTKTGGTTFMQKYLGPVLDPFLRQFVLLNDLTSDAAAAMGTMTAVDEMLEYEEMASKLESGCEAISQEPSLRGRKSQFTVAYSDKAEVTLDRRSWLNWFIEQEQSRLRQNLVDYHRSGGRMPAHRDGKEVTLNMLAREVAEGVQKSKVETGGVGIEVGVFLIARRHLFS